jgi:hypothetical protein
VIEEMNIFFNVTYWSKMEEWDIAVPLPLLEIGCATPSPIADAGEVISLRIHI